MEAYLDNSATTWCTEHVRDVVVKTMMEDYGNPSSKHTKGMEAEKYLREQMALARRDLAYLESVLQEIQQAETEQDFLDIRGEMSDAGFIRKQGKKVLQRPSKPREFKTSGGFRVLVGRNNRQNDKLTLHTARGKDLWFHVQKAPGSHVVVMSRGEDIPDTTRQEAAELAVIYSSAYKAGTGAKVAVDTTEVKNIWKANGAKPGMVLYEVYTTVYITPRDGLEEQLKQKK